MTQAQYFLKPSLGERIFNRVFGIAIGLGVGLGHNFVVEVRGRKSGRIFSAPIDLLEVEKRRYLVAPRGETNWVRNARAAGPRHAAQGAPTRGIRGARGWSRRAPAVAQGLSRPIRVDRAALLSTSAGISHVRVRSDRRTLSGVRTHTDRRGVRAWLISPRPWTRASCRRPRRRCKPRMPRRAAGASSDASSR